MGAPHIVARIITQTHGEWELLCTVRVHGHEVDPARSFKLCAALSMHVRTLLHVIQIHNVDARIVLPQEGDATIADIVPSLDMHAWFAGVSATFIQGCRDLAAEFPRQFLFKITRE